MTPFRTKTHSPSQKNPTLGLFFVVFFVCLCQTECHTPHDDANCWFFSSLGSWSADRLRSAAELPCPVRLAADVRPSHSHCEDQQVGRGQPLPFGRGSSCRGTTVPTSDSLCPQCGFPSVPAAAALWVLWASQAAGSTWLAGKILQGGGSVVSAWIFWVLSLPLCKLLDSKVPALDLPVTPLTCEMLPIWRKFTLFLMDVCLMLLIHAA